MKSGHIQELRKQKGLQEGFFVVCIHGVRERSVMFTYK